ncbi:MAG: 4Fe-4S dicluster domain-containing protein [Lachnospiraceae bacterium]|nr:4Fe-4S dicluster domain-containing protein [Lachnospiraceae bacterium]
MVKWNWDEMGKNNSRAINCKECGKCEKACPQHLSIREDLKKVTADIEKAAK